MTEQAFQREGVPQIKYKIRWKTPVHELKTCNLLEKKENIFQF